MIGYLASLRGKVVVECLQDESLLGYQKVKITDFSQLEKYLYPGSNLFDQNESTAISQDLLVDIQNTELNSTNISLLSQYCAESDSQIYLFSSINILNAEAKKLLKKSECKLLELKKTDKNICEELARNYKTQNTLDNLDFTSIINQADSYYELLDNLEFITLADNQKLALQSILKDQKTGLFIRGFNLANIEKDTKIWFEEVDENNLQLALSLVYGKLDKANTKESKTIQKELILTDQKIKSSSKVKPLTWFKLFLWKSKN